LYGLEKKNNSYLGNFNWKNKSLNGDKFGEIGGLYVYSSSKDLY
jgi:hypothetical protein